MQVTRAILEMWSDNKTEWWWEGASVSYDGEGYIGQVDLFPDHVEPNGGTYVLAIQNSNDRASHHNPQGTAYRLCVTWTVPSEPSYQVYLPLITKNYGPYVKIPDTTKVLSETTIQHLSSISDDGAVFTFSEMTPELEALELGDVIVGGVTVLAPYGFLRKVTGVSADDGQVAIATDQATVEEAIEEGTIEIHKTLTPGDVQGAMQMTGVALNTGPRLLDQEHFIISLDNIVLFDVDGNLATTNDQVKANGQITLEPSIDFRMVIRYFHLNQLVFTVNAVENAELEITADIDYPTIHKEKEIARYYLTPIPVSIVTIFPVLTINVGLDGSVHVGVSTGVTQQATLTAGLIYDVNKGWSNSFSA